LDVKRVLQGLAAALALLLAAGAGYIVANIPNSHRVQLCVAIAQDSERQGERVSFSDESSGCYSDEWKVCGYFRELDASRPPADQNPADFVSQEC
jgi:hypothetical protein